MSNFGERLCELMDEKPVGVIELAAAVKVDSRTVYKWKTNTTLISLKNLLSLADYFQCSLDFLSGQAEIDTEIKGKKEYPAFYDRLRAVMKECKITTYYIRKTTRFKGEFFDKCKNGADPDLQTVVDLAKILDVTIDYLVGRE